MKIRKKEHIHLDAHDALVIVDLQKDFCPGGALAVSGGDLIIPVVNRLVDFFSIHASPDGQHAGFIVATKDWHKVPHDGWPLHCIQGTPGAEFHSGLLYPYHGVFYKGYPGSRGSGYSAFDAVFGRKVPVPPPIGWKISLEEEQTLEKELRDAGIERIFVAGLATDYCIKKTVLDGLRIGFEVFVITDAIAAVNVNPDDGKNALQEMAEAGAHLVRSREIHKQETCNT